MATLTITLPPHAEQTERNLIRWAELLADPELAKIEGRIETDRHGQIIMSPPPAPSHGSRQSKISQMLWNLMTEGEVISECPISTSDGVKAADVAWASPERMRELGNRVCFSRAPEICVEVLSPSNTRAEIEEKKALYFDAGAQEVWVCSQVIPSTGRKAFLSFARSFQFSLGSEAERSPAVREVLSVHAPTGSSWRAAFD
jgi:Uma2 family endonuclease